MARPRAFDEAEVLEAAVDCFWSQGYEATSVRDLAAEMGITGASLYNAFGDKRALYELAFDRYVRAGVHDRIARLEDLPPLEAIETFFAEVVENARADPARKGCFLVNATLELAPHDPEFRGHVMDVLDAMQAFFRRQVEKGRALGVVTRSGAADEVAGMLLGQLLGLRVLSRVDPSPERLNGMLRPLFALLRAPPQGDGTAPP
ncbi:TetR/AcrR family transcriptional regulator [Xanthobacter tagetidis]|uniref:TetR/AcrR family transcriptional regulator n=1 Tax=Xanthobacter tagetidis TaxID=60216 RepID=A0A3L7AHM7_9HYPH|nr:TetR/AcrR family transcriptional regulator [Xanthobacter tagetidis]MBB6306444.1 TetR/AcrR family transcriptional repressor of nem operon [Xanthobacter tagetidis]RLP79697.1 TetR/AcrR family transcriptional regulator [Xanthobacter tagetidis]